MRSHARILCRIWSDEQFKRRSSGAQRMYLLLLSQKWLNHAGIVPLTVQRWASYSPDTTAADIERELEELASYSFIAFDRATDEVLIRTFIRNDGVAKQPNVLKAALRQATEVESPALRAVLADELRKLHQEEASRVADAIEPIGEPFENPTQTGQTSNPSGRVPPDSAEPVPNTSRETRGIGEGGSLEGNPLQNASRSPTRPRARDGPSFADFYAAYPRHVGRKAAERAWAKATKDTDPAEIVAGARRYATERDGEDPKFTAHPATWLNQGRWLDEPAPTPADPLTRKLTNFARQQGLIPESDHPRPIGR